MMTKWTRHRDRSIALHRRLVRPGFSSQPTGQPLEILDRFHGYPLPRSAREEGLNAITHGAGALLAIVGTLLLLYRAAQFTTPAVFAACVVYSLSLLAVLISSTLSHWIHQPHWRHLFRALDQATIYCLIAGTCTPFYVKYLIGTGWDWLPIATWLVALTGTASKLVGFQINRISVSIYLLLGWSPMTAAPVLYAQFPTACSLLIISGGLSYTAGVWFLVNDKRSDFHHPIWHLFVLTGCVCFFLAIWHYVAGP